MPTATAKLSVREREWLVRYIRQSADLVGLRDWTYEVSALPCVSNRAADITLVEGRRIARLAFCAGFRELPERDQREAIAHELVHCHLHGVADVVRVDIAAAIRPTLHSVLWSSFERQLEHAVDAMVPVFARAIPRLTWVKE